VRGTNRAVFWKQSRQGNGSRHAPARVHLDAAPMPNATTPHLSARAA
jgi:hypothetical protein